MIKLLRILGKRGRITIPYEIRKHVGFSYNNVLSFTEAKDGRTVIVRREKICNNCVEHEPTNIKQTADLEDFLDDLKEKHLYIYRYDGRKGRAVRQMTERNPPENARYLEYF